MPVVGKGAQLELKNFEELKRMLDANRFTKRFKKEVKRATEENALTAASAIKIAITEERVGDPNHPLTVLLKKSSKPLVGAEGDLFASIHGKAVRWNLAFIGVLKAKMKKGKEFAPGVTANIDVQQLAAILHEGVDIKVTKKMRRFFAVMAMKFPGKVYPLKAATTVISIPGRPFLDAAFDAGMIAVYQANWEQAVDDVFKALRRGG